MFRKLTAGGAALALATTPLAAGPAPARASEPVSDASRIGDQNNLVFLIGIAVVAVAILFLSEDDDPVSP